MTTDATPEPQATEAAPAADPTPDPTPPPAASGVDWGDIDQSAAHQLFTQYTDPNARQSVVDRTLQADYGISLSDLQQAMQVRQALGDADPSDIANLVALQQQHDNDPLSGLDEGQELSLEDQRRLIQHEASQIAQQQVQEALMEQHTNVLRGTLDQALSEHTNGLGEAQKAFVAAQINQAVNEAYNQRGMGMQPGDVVALAKQARSQFDGLFAAAQPQSPQAPQTLNPNTGQPSTGAEMSFEDSLRDRARQIDAQRRGGGIA